MQHIYSQTSKYQYLIINFALSYTMCIIKQAEVHEARNPAQL